MSAALNTMSIKLIVHKFETGSNFKSLHVIVDDNDAATTKFSDWTEGEIFQNDTTKKSRLIIKLVSVEENNTFNLNACAKPLPDLGGSLYHQIVIDDSKTTFSAPNNGAASVTQQDNVYSNTMHSSHNKAHENNLSVKNYEGMQKFYIWKNYASKTNGINSIESPSPLEYSLERVKENNARIMENILLLNRTLDYAKKKEMLDLASPKPMKSYPCLTCGKCFVYETGLRRHYAMRHAMIEALPHWQDVWTCIECFQVWPVKDLAIEHTKKCCKNENVDCVREMKTSSLLQCEFCEKVYTSIPRLLKHMKVHTTVSNYECNVCGLTFSSYKDAEQHWLACPWLKMCYNFSLPRLLLCNACDRKFRNYEQLYNHRYKAGHFLTKTHNQSLINKSLGILVYQCEMCGQWFPFIASLQAHRSQFHPFCESGMQIKLNKFYKDHENNYETESCLNMKAL